METEQGNGKEEDKRIFKKGHSIVEDWANQYADPFVCSQDWPY